MRKRLAAVGTTALLLTTGIGISLATAPSAWADKAYCKAMYGSYEDLLYQGNPDNSRLQVRELQCELNSWKPSLNLTQDGIFGPATRSAVITFQKWAGITADGIVGYQTWTELDIWCDYLET